MLVFDRELVNSYLGFDMVGYKIIFKKEMFIYLWNRIVGIINCKIYFY